MVIGILSSALDLARRAVERDAQGEPDARALYGKAVRAMDTALRLLPQDVPEADYVRKHRDAYALRVEELKGEEYGEGEDTTDAKKQDSPPSRQGAFEQMPFRPMELSTPVEVSPISSEAGRPSIASIEPAPWSSVRRPYWTLRLVKSTIEGGGFLTPRLFVPAEVWCQSGIRFAGFSPKVAAFEAVMYLLSNNISPLPMPSASSLAAQRSCLVTLSAFREQLLKLQSELSRSFAFVPDPEAGGALTDLLGVAIDDKSAAIAARQGQAPDSSKAVKNAQDGAAGGGGLGMRRLNTFVRNIGKGVKTGMQRIGASLPATLMDDEMLYYTQLVKDMCSSCQVLDEWTVAIKSLREDGAIAGAKDPTAGASDVAEKLLQEMHNISNFVRVIAGILLGDVELLLKTYMGRMRESLLGLGDSQVRFPQLHEGGPENQLADYNILSPPSLRCFPQDLLDAR